MNEVILSVVIITMNRKAQLAEAIQSCLDADLPPRSEIVIVDNGSTDGTEEYIREKFSNISSIRYYKQEYNLGVAGGRNLGVQLAEGKYVYHLDDDAVIAPKCYKNFFTSSLNMLESDDKIGAITTLIYDEALCRYRNSRKARSYSETDPQVLAVHGGSHFLRKGISGVEYCPSIKYGFEDLYASIRLDDTGYKVLLNEGTEIIHKPLINKWNKDSPFRKNIMIKEIAGKLTVKSLLFPGVFFPLLYIAAFTRTLKHIGLQEHHFKSVMQLYREQTAGINIPKVKIKTVFFLVKEYGISAIV